MTNYVRHIDHRLREHFNQYREILLLLGPRQSGKTTLLKRLFPNAAYLLVDNEPTRKALESYDLNTYKQLFSANKQLIIDEIHLLSNPGRAAKIIYDQMPNLNLIITGSSSLNIKNKTAESLAGRFVEYQLMPLTFSEYLVQTGLEKDPNFQIFELLTTKETHNKNKAHLFDVWQALQNVTIYGLYPHLVDQPQNAEYLINLANTLAFKDIDELSLIEKRRDAINLLKLLAFQTGNLINYSELASKLGLNQETVKRYLEIFEQSFIIYRLYPYFQNKRLEISKSPKVYFYDTGLRNAIINNFSSLDLRPDAGSLFENFLVNETLKANLYSRSNYNLNYWRTKQGSEVDLVISSPNKLFGIETKLGTERASGLAAFINHYPQAAAKVISSKNFY